MAKAPASPADYIDALPVDKRDAMRKLRAVINANLPTGFAECISYGAIGYVVPHSLYPAGYHCDPKLPLPLMMIASTKGHIAFHHMGVYCDPTLLQWLTKEWKASSAQKLDMGKGCIRFKNPAEIPLALIGRLVKKLSAKQWIAIYEEKLASRAPAKGRAAR